MTSFIAGQGAKNRNQAKSSKTGNLLLVPWLYKGKALWKSGVRRIA